MLGIFDSGIGGLTVVRAIEQELPGASYVYLGDTARLPYGTKTAPTIARYTRDALGFLQEQGTSVPVVACHTASSVIVSDENLRNSIEEDFDGPLYDVVTPAVEGARVASRSGRIGVLGTTATIRSGVYETLMHDAAVTAVAASVLVGLAEEGFSEPRQTGPILEEILNPFLRADVDVIVLACTHFPILEEGIRAILGSDIVLVDPGEELAKRLKPLRASLPEGEQRFFATDIADDFSTRASRFLGRPVEASQA